MSDKYQSMSENSKKISE